MEEVEVCNFKVEKIKISIDKLTDIQKAYVTEIENYKYKYKRIPTIRKICELVDCSSTGSVYAMLDRLSYKGYDYRILNYGEGDVSERLGGI